MATSEVKEPIDLAEAGNRKGPQLKATGKRISLFATGTTHQSVLVSFSVNGVETIALATAAWITGSVALGAQTAANFAGVAVDVFLLIGLLSSGRSADERHPLGYGRERFVWSLFAALGILVGGGGIAIEGAVRSALHPSTVDSYPVAYTVLLVTIVLDGLALRVGFRPLRKEATVRGTTVRAHMRQSTDPAAITVVVGGVCAVVGGVIATVGLVVSEATHTSGADTVASALIGLLLLIASVVLLRTNLELLTGRGIAPSALREMRTLIMSQDGVLDVPDLFAVVVGPSSLIVDGDLTFEPEVEVPQLELAIAQAAVALRDRWPSIEYVYLTPVAKGRPRRMARGKSARAGSPIQTAKPKAGTRTTPTEG